MSDNNVLFKNPRPFSQFKLVHSDTVIIPSNAQENAQRVEQMENEFKMKQKMKKRTPVTIL